MLEQDVSYWEELKEKCEIAMVLGELNADATPTITRQEEVTH